MTTKKNKLKYFLSNFILLNKEFFDEKLINQINDYHVNFLTPLKVFQKDLIELFNKIKEYEQFNIFELGYFKGSERLILINNFSKLIFKYDDVSDSVILQTDIDRNYVIPKRIINIFRKIRKDVKSETSIIDDIKKFLIILKNKKEFYDNNIKTYSKTEENIIENINSLYNKFKNSLLINIDTDEKIIITRLIKFTNNDYEILYLGNYNQLYEKLKSFFKNKYKL